ncbi:hypothetical protein PFISCL1PPCAC_11681, partial [Pristionchus fissidentatus]
WRRTKDLKEIYELKQQLMTSPLTSPAAQLVPASLSGIVSIIEKMTFSSTPEYGKIRGFIYSIEKMGKMELGRKPFMPGWIGQIPNPADGVIRTKPVEDVDTKEMRRRREMERKRSRAEEKLARLYKDSELTPDEIKAAIRGRAAEKWEESNEPTR